MEKGGREGERKGKGGERGSTAGRRSHDPCDAVGILMSHKVPWKKLRRNKVHRETCAYTPRNGKVSE